MCYLEIAVLGLPVAAAHDALALADKGHKGNLPPLGLEHALPQLRVRHGPVETRARALQRQQVLAVQEARNVQHHLGGEHLRKVHGRRLTHKGGQLELGAHKRLAPQSRRRHRGQRHAHAFPHIGARRKVLDGGGHSVESAPHERGSRLRRHNCLQCIGVFGLAALAVLGRRRDDSLVSRTGSAVAHLRCDVFFALDTDS